MHEANICQKNENRFHEIKKFKINTKSQIDLPSFLF